MITRRVLAWGLGLAACALLSACSAPRALSAATEPPTAAPSTATAEIGCSVVDTVPTPAAAAPWTAVTTEDFARGPASAPVTLLFYCDFQSGQCELFNRVLDQLVVLHPDDLRVVMRPFGIPAAVAAGLDKSELAAQAALAAGAQGKFWDIRDALHSAYAEWTPLSPTEFKAWIKSQAADLKLDVPKFDTDFASTAVESPRQESVSGCDLSRHLRRADGIY